VFRARGAIVRSCCRSPVGGGGNRVLIAISSWNEFLLPLMLTTSQGIRTWPVGLQLMVGRIPAAVGALRPAGIISIAPILLFFALAHARFVRRLTLGAVKGYFFLGRDFLCVGEISENVRLGGTALLVAGGGRGRGATPNPYLRRRPTAAMRPRQPCAGRADCTVSYWHTFTSQASDGPGQGHQVVQPEISEGTVNSENVPNSDFMAKFTLAVQAAEAERP